MSLSTLIYNAGRKKVPGMMANDDASVESLRVPQGVEKFFASGIFVVCAQGNRRFPAC
jgi:hypothetical protein